MQPILGIDTQLNSSLLGNILTTKSTTRFSLHCAMFLIGMDERSV